MPDRDRGRGAWERLDPLSLEVLTRLLVEGEPYAVRCLAIGVNGEESTPSEGAEEERAG